MAKKIAKKKKMRNLQGTSVVKFSGGKKDPFTRMLGFNADEIERYSDIAKQKPAKQFEKFREILKEYILEDKSVSKTLDVSYVVNCSQSLLQGYATLDWEHHQDIEDFIHQLTLYLNDGTRKRPLNSLMLAEPGAGKSHFIKCVAKKLKAEKVATVTFNMATMRSPDDMARSIDDLRNLKVNDKFPLLFLDEFDSDPANYSFLLPLLWDGEIHLGHRDLQLGKAIVVLAGSNPALPKIMEKTGKMVVLDAADEQVQRKEHGKLTDLLSRINGAVIEIPDLDIQGPGTRDRRLDKVCIALQLLRLRFGNTLEEIPQSLLRFIALTKFRYGVRSIAHLIDLIPSDAFSGTKLSKTKLGLPIGSEKDLRKSSLSMHVVDENQALGVVNRWKGECKRGPMIRATSNDQSSLLFDLLIRDKIKLSKE